MKTQLTFDLGSVPETTTIETTTKKRYIKQSKNIQLVFDLGQKTKKHQKKISLNYIEEKTNITRYYDRFDYGSSRFNSAYYRRACETYNEFETNSLSKPLKQNKNVFDARIKERELRMKKLENSVDMMRYADDIIFAVTNDVDDDMFEAVDALMRLMMGSFLIDFATELKTEWQIYERLRDASSLLLKQDSIISTAKAFDIELKQCNISLFLQAKDILMDYYNKKFRELDRLCDIIFPTRKKIRNQYYSMSSVAA